MCRWTRGLLFAAVLLGACHKKDDAARPAPAPAAPPAPAPVGQAANAPVGAAGAPGAAGTDGAAAVKPTDAECDLAVANLKKVLGPEALSGGNEDRADCLK